ncbi:hypothetical protein PsYK624_104100 [Phanerochaete sordida]|uniref:Uncharacterized protein n=1 Tax=Phanerochaete sordida TaxID=48140 RepID=A0A9P3LHK7_9APHY|nr:hypothetical protein PsYK624_104100 [Phanerochaete sordida]
MSIHHCEGPDVAPARYCQDSRATTPSAMSTLDTSLSHLFYTYEIKLHNRYCALVCGTPDRLGGPRPCTYFQDAHKGLGGSAEYDCSILHVGTEPALRVPKVRSHSFHRVMGAICVQFHACEAP